MIIMPSDHEHVLHARDVDIGREHSTPEYYGFCRVSVSEHPWRLIDE